MTRPFRFTRFKLPEDVVEQTPFVISRASARSSMRWPVGDLGMRIPALVLLAASMVAVAGCGAADESASS